MNKSSLKSNLPIILAFAIPVLMIVIVALVVYLPALFLNPQSDFVYATQLGQKSPLYTGARYIVTDGKISVECFDAYRAPFVKEDLAAPTLLPKEACTATNSDAGTLFLHDVETNKSKELSFTDAQALTLNNKPISPDGYEVVSAQYNGDIFPFISGATGYGTKYLKGRYGSKKLDLQLATDSYNNFTFIGWVESK